MTNSLVEQQEKVCLNGFLYYELVCKMQIGWGKLHSSFAVITFQVTGLLCFKTQQEAATKTSDLWVGLWARQTGAVGGSVSLSGIGGAIFPLIPTSD